MNFTIRELAANMVPLACMIVAGLLATSGKPGWGWFLFVGFLCVGAIECRSNSQKS